jgi:hypothetical protein
MASAYGVVQTGTKQPNQIRKELEDILVRNDKLRRSNPIIKGTKEFLEEMKVTDSVLLRAFVQKAIDESKLSCGLNGMWKIGDKAVVQVPQRNKGLDSKIRYLCNFMSLANQTEKLTEFMRDLINREYLDSITNKQEWVWLGKIAGVPTQFKKLEEIQKGVTDFFYPSVAGLLRRKPSFLFPPRIRVGVVLFLALVIKSLSLHKIFRNDSC